MTSDSYHTQGARQDRAADRAIQERQAVALEKIAELLETLATAALSPRGVLNPRG